MVDTGTESSVLLVPGGPLSKTQTWVQGAKETTPLSWTTQRMVDLGMGRVPNPFLVIANCPYPLLGRNLLFKMKTQIQFAEQGAILVH